nr:hypothetical protein GCM10020093_050220 [Planobispora longispora]
MTPTIVWGTGNVGRAAIRAVEAHPALELTGVLVHDPRKAGRDAGDLGGLGRDLGVAATDDIDAALAARPGAVVYAASGDIRPDDALADIVRAIRAGAVVVTPRSTPSTTSATPRRSCGSRFSPRSRRAAARCSSPASIPAGATTCCPC